MVYHLLHQKIKSAFFPCLLLIGILAFKKSVSQVVINEYSCSNLNSIVDNFGKSEDWIELYNNSTSAVNIGGYYLSDNPNKPMKYKIPAGITIPANGFFSLWASGRNILTGSLHTNFKLKQTKVPGERIILSDSSGIGIDSVVINKTQLAHSMGRITNGSSNWGVFVNPTFNASNNTSASYRYADNVVFSINSPGYYSGPVSVELSTSELNSVIRYTLNGNEPKSTSQVYSGPINISGTMVLKAKVFSTSTGVLPGFMAYGTYFINVNHTIPVVSISGDSLTELANGDKSIFPNGLFEYFGTDKLLKTKSTGEFNSHGQDSWACDQRSLDFVARDEQGDNYALQHQIFQTSARTEFQRIILRASGDDNYPCGHNSANAGSAHMRDGYIQNLADRGNLHLDVRRSKRVVAYLNGAYWGVYELREKMDDPDYTDFNYDQDKYNLQFIMTWGSTWAEFGGNQALSDWQTLYSFIMNNDMANASNYAKVDSQLNIKSLIDYYIVNSFTVCSDWLNYNTGWWRGLNPSGEHKKWGYILWDNDATFDFYINYTGIPDTSPNAEPCGVENSITVDDPEGHIKIINRLDANPGFHEYYVNRQADLLNTVFGCQNMLSYLDQYRQIIAPEMTMHSARWNGTLTEWQQNVQQLKVFISQRCTGIETGMLDCYNLTGPYDLTLDVTPAGSGTIKMNSVEVVNYPWTARIFGGINTNLKANEMDTTFEFLNWTSAYQTFAQNDFDTNVVISVTQADTVIANFKDLIGPTKVNKPMNSGINATVYPTITSSEINVQYELEKSETVKFEIFSAMGTKVLEFNSAPGSQAKGVNNVKIDLARTNLCTGIYYLKFRAGDEEKNFKIIFN